MQKTQTKKGGMGKDASRGFRAKSRPFLRALIDASSSRKDENGKRSVCGAVRRRGSFILKTDGDSLGFVLKVSVLRPDFLSPSHPFLLSLHFESLYLSMYASGGRFSPEFSGLGSVPCVNSDTASDQLHPSKRRVFLFFSLKRRKLRPIIMQPRTTRSSSICQMDTHLLDAGSL